LEAICCLKQVLCIKHPDSFQTHLVSKLEQLLIEESQYRYKRKMCDRIYNAWYDALSSPYTRVGKKRILNQYYELTSL
jgi:hypothetical protein